MSNRSTQKIPTLSAVKGRSAEASVAPRTVDFVLDSGMTVTFAPASSGSKTADVNSGLHKILDVKGALGRLFETIATSDIPSDTVEALLAEVADSVTHRQSLGGGLTQANADFLVSSGALTLEKLESLEARVSAGELAQKERAVNLGAIIRTQTAEQVGQRLGISTSRVRHRQSGNHLYAFLAGKSRHYPLWQFIGDSDRVVPKLAEVVPFFLDGWRPASIEGFMTTPQEDLTSADHVRLTPVEWLASGGDPAEVTAILRWIAQS